MSFMIKTAHPYSSSDLKKKPTPRMMEEIKDAVERIYDDLNPKILDTLKWTEYVPAVIGMLQDQYPAWKSFNEEMHVRSNPCYTAIYHATRNVTRRKPQTV